MTLPPPFLDAVRTRFDRVVEDDDELRELGTDWTRVHAPRPSLAVEPKGSDDVRELVLLCHEHRVALVPSGGRTGLAGGAVAPNGEVVLSLRRLNQLGPIDSLGHTVRVGAGAITEAVHRHCEAENLTWPVDFASKGSSQVGGNIATNAGGVRVIRHGLTRQWVLGLQVVTGTGELLELGGALEKDNTGLDLRQLFIGSEGILGVITEATLKLCPRSGPRSVFLFAVEDLGGVLRLFRHVRARPELTIGAFEFFTDQCLARLKRHRKVRDPMAGASSHYVLLEIDQVDEATRDRFLEELSEEELIVDGTLAQTEAQATELWGLREGISESLSATGLPHKNDISLPIAGLEAFCRDLVALFGAEYPSFEICLFGHIGDGNLHVNVMKPDTMEKAAFLAEAREADEKMFALVQNHRGSISAEHGIGLLKKPYLGYRRSPEELALMRRLKAVFDPRGIMNPGKVL
ncbi:MAG: FAD-binding oxidoreductase [Myxococcota bacterium]